MREVIAIKSLVHFLGNVLPAVAAFGHHLYEDLLLLLTPLPIVVIRVEFPPAEVMAALHASVRQRLSDLAPSAPQRIRQFLLRFGAQIDQALLS